MPTRPGTRASTLCYRVQVAALLDAEEAAVVPAEAEPAAALLAAGGAVSADADAGQAAAAAPEPASAQAEPAEQPTTAGSEDDAVEQAFRWEAHVAQNLQHEGQRRTLHLVAHTAEPVVR